MIRKKPTKIQGSIGLKQKSLLTTVFHDRPRIHLTRQFPHSSSAATFLTVSSSLAPDSSRPPPPPSSHRSLEKMCRKTCPLTWRRCRRHTRDIDKSWSRVEAREMNGFVGAFFVQDNPAPARFFVDTKFFACTSPQLPPHVGAIRNCIPRCPTHGGRH